MDEDTNESFSLMSEENLTSRVLSCKRNLMLRCDKDSMFATKLIENKYLVLMGAFTLLTYLNTLLMAEFVLEVRRCSERSLQSKNQLSHPLLKTCAVVFLGSGCVWAEVRSASSCGF